MPVITISRYTGSGGQAIGEKVAERLGAEYLDQQLVQEVARRLGIGRSTLYRKLGELGIGDAA